METISGRCLCEAIRYEVAGQLGPIFHCHCSKCRRWHGAAFRTRASVERSQFKWTLGEELLVSFQSSDNVTKFFCKTCGSPLVSTYKDMPDVLGLPLGGIDQELGARPEAHIFVNSKASWFEIFDDLPQYDNWPGSEAKVRETR